MTPSTAARQASLSFTISRSLLKVMSTELVMPCNHLVLCHPLSSCLLFFPASGSLLMSWLFASGGQSIGASALVLPGQADMSPGVQGSGLSTAAPSVMLRKQHPSCYPHFPWNVTSHFVEEAPSCLYARKYFSPIWKLFNKAPLFPRGDLEGFPKAGL